MEQDRQEAAEQVGEEVSAEAVAAAAGWEALAPVPGQVGNVSAPIVGHVSHIRSVVHATA